MKRYVIIFLLMCSICLPDTFTSSLKPKTTNTIDIGTSSLQWDNAWGDGIIDWDTITDGAFSITEGVGTGLVSLTDGTASWSGSSLSGFTSISGTTLTDTILSITGGSITSAVNGTFSSTLTAGTFTDSTTTITGGNYTGVGNLTGTDIDISAGTGSFTGSGTSTFGQIIDSGLTASKVVFTDGSKQLTSTAITTGDGVYWNRTGTVLSPIAAGDDITTIGKVTAGEINVDNLNFDVFTILSDSSLVIQSAANAVLVIFNSSGIIQLSNRTLALTGLTGSISDGDDATDGTKFTFTTMIGGEGIGAKNAGDGGGQTWTTGLGGNADSGNSGSAGQFIFNGALAGTSVIGGVGVDTDFAINLVGTGKVDLTGGFIQTGNYDLTGNLDIIGDVTLTGDFNQSGIMTLRDVANDNGVLILDVLGADADFEGTGDGVRIASGSAKRSATTAIVDIYAQAAGTSAPDGYILLNKTGMNLRIGSAVAPTNLVSIASDGKIDFRDNAIGIYSQADTFLDLFADGAVRIGDSSGGAPTHYLNIDTSSDTADAWWVGSGSGWPYACMFVDGTQAIIVALSTGVIAEVKDDDTTSLDDGWLAGDLNLITFPTGGDEHYLSVTKAGFYRIQWSLSFNTANPGANVEIHGGIAVDGVAIRNKAEAHRTIANNSDTGNMSGTAMIDCPNGTEQISVWLLNSSNNADVTVEHGNVSMLMVGGT